MFLSKFLPGSTIVPTVRNNQQKIFSIRNQKKVQFEERYTVTLVESYRDYSSSECRSVWYSEKEYRSFSLEKTWENLTASLPLRRKRHERTLRNENIRHLLVEAQSARFVRKKSSRRDCDFSQWLADFYEKHSEPCVIEARQRAIENDLELINIKLREASSRLLKRSTLFKKLEVSTTYDKDTNNARWSGSEGTLLGDEAPHVVRSSYGLRRQLCKDFNLIKGVVGNSRSTSSKTKLINHMNKSKPKHDRWSAVPSKNGRRKSQKRDQPLNPLSHRRISSSNFGDNQSTR